jgi:hypothetical protein
MKKSALCLLAVIGMISSLPAAEASKGPPTPLDAKAVQILITPPGQTYEELGFVVTEKSPVRIKTEAATKTQRRTLQLCADILNALPDLQSQAAALGANALILTGIESTLNGFVQRRGAPDTREPAVQVSGVAIRLTTAPASGTDLREFASQLASWLDSQSGHLAPAPKPPAGYSSAPSGPAH